MSKLTAADLRRLGQKKKVEPPTPVVVSGGGGVLPLPEPASVVGAAQEQLGVPTIGRATFLQGLGTAVAAALSVPVSGKGNVPMTLPGGWNGTEIRQMMLLSGPSGFPGDGSYTGLGWYHNGWLDAVSGKTIHLGSWVNDVLQVGWSGDDGSLPFGGGNGVLNGRGLSFLTGIAAPNQVKWVDSLSSLTPFVSATINGNTTGTTPNREGFISIVASAESGGTGRSEAYIYATDGAGSSGYILNSTQYGIILGPHAGTDVLSAGHFGFTAANSLDIGAPSGSTPIAPRTIYVGTSVLSDVDNGADLGSTTYAWAGVYRYLDYHKETTAPSTPSAGWLAGYVDTSHNFRQIDSLGQDLLRHKGERWGYAVWTADAGVKTLINPTIKAGSLGTKGIVLVDLWLVVSNTGATTVSSTITITFGSTTLFSFATFATGTTTPRHIWYHVMFSIANAASASAQLAQFTLFSNSAGLAYGTGLDTGATLRDGANVATENSGNDLALAVTEQLSTATNSKFELMAASMLGPYYAA